MLPRSLKLAPGDRARINQKSLREVPSLRGMYASLGIGGIVARHYLNGEYLVSAWLPSLSMAAHSNTTPAGRMFDGSVGVC